MGLYAYITNYGSNNVSVINTATNTVSTTITVGHSPSGAAVSPNGNKVYVANSQDNTVSVIDTATNTVGATITVGTQPGSIGITPNGNKVYVSNNDAGTVSVIDAATNTVIATITVGTTFSGPHGIAFSPDSSKAYVAVGASNSIKVIDTATNTVSTTITVGTNPQILALTPDGSKVYVANSQDNTVSVINTATNTVSTTITVGTSPSGVAITPDGSKAYIVNFGNSNVTPSTVSVIDTSTDTVSTTITVGIDPNCAAVTPDGSQVYVTNEHDGTVSVIDTATNTVGTTITVGTTPVTPAIQQRIPDMNGFLNKFRNGTMDVWQRGSASIIVSTSSAYTADGWIVVPTGASCTAQQTASNTRTGAQSTYSLLMTGATSVTDISVKQRIESFIAQQLEGQTVTVQAQVYNNTGGAITPTLTVKHAGSADNWSSPTTDVSAVSLQSCANATWTQVAYTFTASTSSGNGLEITFDFGNNFSTTGKSVQITELDIRATPGVATGVNSAPPIPELRPIPAELAFNQRYFETNFPLGTTPADNTVGSMASRMGTVWSTNLMRVYQPYKVPKFGTSFTITFYRSTNESTNGRWGYYASGWQTATSTSVGDSKQDAFTADLGTSGISANASAMVDGYWTCSAEL